MSEFDGKAAYCAARILPSVSAEVRCDSAILVESGRITAVVGQADVPSDYRRVEFGGQWLLPGLIDAHVHLVWDGGMEPEDALQAETSEMSVLQCMRRANDHLMAGVTTIRDLGAPYRTILAIRDAISQGIVTGPRIVAAGNLIARTGGHELMRTIVAGPQQVRRAVEHLVSAGVDFIKVAATGGVFNADDEVDRIELGPAELRAAVAAAHAADRKVAVHAYTVEGIHNAIAAGADTIEHASFLDDETAHQARTCGQVIVPTLLAYRRYGELGPEAGLPRNAVGKAGRAVTAGRAAIGYALAHGVPIAAGTDAGGRGKPHGWIARELTHLVDAGLRPGQAFAAATTVAAKACDRADVGEIAPRCRADIIGADGDPTTDIRVLSRIRTVIVGGRVVKSDSRPDTSAHGPTADGVGG